jgi:hypothetical protein
MAPGVATAVAISIFPGVILFAFTLIRLLGAPLYRTWMVAAARHAHKNGTGF